MTPFSGMCGRTSWMDLAARDAAAISQTTRFAWRAANLPRRVCHAHDRGPSAGSSIDYDPRPSLIERSRASKGSSRLSLFGDEGATHLGENRVGTAKGGALTKQRPSAS